MAGGITGRILRGEGRGGGCNLSVYVIIIF